MTDQAGDHPEDESRDRSDEQHQDHQDQDQGQPDNRTEPQPDDSGPTDRPDGGWSTGDTRVDDAVARLEGLDERDLHEHVDVYDSVHRDLADVLDDAGTPPSSA